MDRDLGSGAEYSLELGGIKLEAGRVCVYETGRMIPNMRNVLCAAVGVFAKCKLVTEEDLCRTL
jgi:hypothetical protein